MLSSKVVVITGASSGIGRATALALAHRGATVVLIARRKKLLKEVLEQVREFSPDSSSFVCDVSNQAQVKRAVDSILKKYNRVDILINNAGVGIAGSFEESAVEDMKRVMNVNYWGAVYFMKYLIPGMKRRNSGHIINISSVAGKLGFPGSSGYVATKFALYGLSESIYYELKGQGIAVSVVCPGLVATEFKYFGKRKTSPINIVRAIPPKRVVKAILRAIETRNFEVIVPWKYKLAVVFRESLMPIYLKLFQLVRKN